jgi:hypothetical protein
VREDVALEARDVAFDRIADPAAVDDFNRGIRAKPDKFLAHHFRIGGAGAQHP